MMVAFATLGPLGRLPAPGTWGSAAGLLWWSVVVRFAHARGWQHELIFDLLVVAAAVLICGVAVVLLGKKDPSEVILDEFAAMPLVFLFNPHVHAGRANARPRGGEAQLSDPDRPPLCRQSDLCGTYCW